MGVMTVWERRYEVPTHEYSVGLAVSSAAMVGRAMETTELSRLEMKATRARLGYERSA